MTIKTTKSLEDIFYQYTHLLFGKKEIACPYWIDNLKKLKHGPGGGKATPSEIINLTKKKALENNINLEQLSEKEIVSFMKKNRIGIDCSGFAFWLLNELDLEKGGNGIADDIPESKGRFIKFRASTTMLTDPLVSNPVEKVSDIMPGDMIRMRKGHHLLVVFQVEKNSQNNPEKIVYVHSSSPLFTSISGVHQQSILITDPKKSLKDQNWLETTPDNSNYANQLFPQEKDGVCRLKIWS